MSDLSKKIDRADSFWDLSELVPKRKNSGSFSSDTSTVTVPLDEEKADPLSEAVPSRAAAALQDKLYAARNALKNAENKIYSSKARAYGDRDNRSLRAECDSAYSHTKARNESDFDDKPEIHYLSEKNKIETEYSAENNPLIISVTVKHWNSEYFFYERFHSDAVRLYGKEGNECEAVPFFSFTPQYSQLSKQQLKFYLYLRSQIRQGKYPMADYSYLLLMIYEIINLPEYIDPSDGVNMLTDILIAYKKAYPKLTRYLSEWICDYCLVRRVSPPMKKLAPIVSELTYACSLKEFYIGTQNDGHLPISNALLAYGSNYNFYSSKFITEGNKEFFEKHIREAFLTAFDKLETDYQGIFSVMGKRNIIEASTSREAFKGAICVYSVKRNVEVKYRSFSRSAELRHTVTDSIKYCENKVRGLLGIKSRFHTPTLLPTIKQLIDTYFLPYTEKRKAMAVKSPKPIPEYEKRYEPIKSNFSLEYAKEIEKRAWNSTALLVSDGDFGEDLDSEDVSVNASEISQVKSTDSRIIAAKALTLLLNENTDDFLLLAKEHGMLKAALADAINEELFDYVGDKVVDDIDGRFTIVDDYRKEIDEWLKR